jgi:N-acetylmuramoyl-L-alanine amidase
MVAPDKPLLGTWRRIGRALAICAAGLLIPAAGIAQSSEIKKSLSSGHGSGETEIRKSQPAPDARREAESFRIAPGPARDAPAAGGNTVTATHADVTVERGLTRFSLLLSARARYHISSMASPYRIVLDLPDVDFRLPGSAGEQGRGLVRAFRYGLLAPGKARVVIDTTQPVRVQKHAITAQAADEGVRLVLDLAPTDKATFLAGVALPATSRPNDSHSADGAGSDAPAAVGSRPIIVIDPGHGGLDPGALGAGFREKDVVLAVSHHVRAALEASGRYDVHMTRSDDVFISLPQRVAFSRSRAASLFVSIHANSVPVESPNAAIVRGAAIYTLSEEATTREAQRLADQENAADLLAGVDSRMETTTEVDRILSDLKWRETSEFSADFRGRLLTHLKGVTPLSREPSPSAAFMVLRQGDCPSVLVELGYISNAKDAQLLVSPDWQREVGHKIADAVNDFFTTHGYRP